MFLIPARTVALLGLGVVALGGFSLRKGFARV